MQIHRFFCPLELEINENIQLPEHISHYAGRVLRLKNNTQIVLFNGNGGQYLANIHFDKKRAFANIQQFQNINNELSGRINILQGIASANKMDWIVEKASELGVSNVIPIAAQYSILQLQGARLEKRLDHWQRISHGASEQCGRNKVLKIHTVMPLVNGLDFIENEFNNDENSLTLICHQEASTDLTKVVSKFKQQLNKSLLTTKPVLNLIIGPEGGWSDNEVAVATKSGAKAVIFGNRVFRTETAGIALSAACTALLGWQ